MKKILLLLICLGLAQNSKALTIQQVTVSAIENSNNLNIHTQVGNGHYFEYSHHSYSIENNTITLSICYLPITLSAITTKENDFVLPDVNFNQAAYTLIVKVNFQTWNGTEYSCNNQVLSDTASLSFETPLNNAVQLATQDFNIHQDKLVLYPNPTAGICSFNPDLLPSAKSVQIYDCVGRLVQNNVQLNQNTLNISGLSNGIYWIQLTTDQQKLTGKIILKK